MNFLLCRPYVLNLNFSLFSNFTHTFIPCTLSLISHHSFILPFLIFKNKREKYSSTTVVLFRDIVFNWMTFGDASHPVLLSPDCSRLPQDSGFKDKELRVTECSAELNFTGALASRVFLHQKATMEEAVKVTSDIVVV